MISEMSTYFVMFPVDDFWIVILLRPIMHFTLISSLSISRPFSSWIRSISILNLSASVIWGTGVFWGTCSPSSLDCYEQTVAVSSSNSTYFELALIKHYFSIKLMQKLMVLADFSCIKSAKGPNRYLKV